MKINEEHVYRLANTLFEQNIPFKYKRTMVWVQGIQLELPKKGKIKTYVVLESEKWKNLLRITSKDLYENSLSKLI
ncbi:MAG: hypothetical protein ACW97P_10480 [Candidatus Hodarchaeales archaeon]|jgi:hypothetical protein